MLRRRNQWFWLWNASRNYRLLVIVICLVLILIAAFLTANNDSTNGANKVGLHDSGGVTVESINGKEVIWQIPDSPKAVLFLAHGCNGRTVNFWDKSPNCPDCVGLPEERLIVLNALARKFAVVTISSHGACWSLGKERLTVRDIIKGWLEKNDLAELPLVALGASSGGYFVSVLATDLRFSSVVLMIAEGVFNQINVTKDYPPILFVHMPKDRVRNRRIAENIQLLREKGIDTQEIKCMQFPLTPNFLASRIPGLDQTISVRLYTLFLDKGFIDASGYMKKDGRRTPWREAMKEFEIHLPFESNFIHHIQEELNLAFAYHEMTSLQVEQIFEWFESHMK
ncbi:hypothetical protein Ancab_030301 [Ancistrocladus abbreviatus]